MSYAIDRAARTATALGLAGALFAVSLGATPLGLAATGAAAAESGQFRLAQAASAPPRAPAKAPAAAPAQVNEVEQQIADLQKKLRITPPQQPQFDAFAQVMRQNAQAMDAMMAQQQQKAGATAVDDLRASAQLAEAEAEGLKRLVPALQALYDSLPDPQKRLADSVMAGQPGPGDAPPKAAPKR